MLCFYVSYLILLSAGSSTPTYGDLIDLYEEVKSKNPNNVEVLLSEFKKIYPECPVGRATRFYDAVQRIIAPTKPSVIKKPCLNGSPLQSYRRKEWKPRIRNPMGSAPGLWMGIMFSY